MTAEGVGFIERRLAAMQAFHGAGVRTACFVPPIFPGITDVSPVLVNFFYHEKIRKSARGKGQAEPKQPATR